jgi:hypothetical protein
MHKIWERFIFVSSTYCMNMKKNCSVFGYFFFFFYVTIQCPCLIHKNHMQFSLSVVSVKTDGKKEVYI